MGYFYGLLLLSFLAGTVEYLCPGAENGLRKHLRLLCGLLTLAALFRPLLALGNSLAEGNPAETLSGLWERVTEGAEEGDIAEQWEAEYTRLDTAFAAAGIRELLCERYGVSENCLSVTVRSDETGESIAHIAVALSGRGIWLDAADMETYLEETFSCTCAVFAERSGE